MTPGFLEKLIERIGRIRPEEMQAYLLRLAREKGFLETIFNAIHEGVIVTDPQGNISFVNEAACTLFGLSRDECIGKLLSDRISGLDWNSLAHSETVISRDMEVFYPRNRFLNFYVTPIVLQPRDEEPAAKSRRKPRNGPEPDGGLVGFAIILRDITETRRTTEQAIESERLNALTLLSAGVAHEIGNPLNSLHIHLQLLERKLRRVPEEMRADLQNSIRVAREEVGRLDSINSSAPSAPRRLRRRWRISMSSCRNRSPFSRRNFKTATSSSKPNTATTCLPSAWTASRSSRSFTTSSRTPPRP